MTFIKKFESIKKKIGAFDASALEGKIAMQINMVDEDCGGAFYVEASEGILSVEPYDYNDRTVMLTLKAADIVALVDKKASLDDLVAAGEVTVEGNYDHAKAIFELKKPVAKKTTKKAPAKKEEKAEVKVEKATEPKEKKTAEKAEAKAVKAPAKKESKAVKATAKKETKVAEKTTKTTKK